MTAPRLSDSPTAPWPGQVGEHDVVVPLVVVVSAEGAVTEALVETSVDPKLDRAALEAARAYRFEPALRDGQPVASRVRIAVRFVGVAKRKPVEERAAPAAASTTPSKRPAAPLAAKKSAAATGPTVHVQGEHAPIRTASQSVQDRRVVKAAPHRTASDTLSVVPGVYVSQHSGEGKAHQIFFRGFDAVHGQDIEIWAGGAPVNDVSNIHGQGYADLHFVMPEVIQEIRSSPGNYDPEQGDFAVAGSLNFTLGYDEPGLTASAGAGSFGARRYFLAYHPKDAPSSTFAAFESYATDGFGPARAARRNSALGQMSFALGGGATARVLAGAYAGRFDSAGVLRLSDIESGRVDRFATYDGKQGGYSSRSQLVLDIGEQDDDAHWSIAPFVVLRSLELRQNFTGYLESPQGDSVQQLNDATTFGAHGHYRRRLKLLSANDSVEGGFFARSDSVEQSQLRLSLADDSVTDTQVDARVKATNVAGYVDAALHPLRRVVLRGGLRLDGLSYQTTNRGGQAQGQSKASLGAQLSKRGTLDVALLPGLHALVSYGEGFRSPQARSLTDGETTPFTRVASYEAGLRFAQGRRLAASLAAFQTNLSDDLVFDESTARNERVPGTRRTGVAASLVSAPNPWFVSSSSFTYTRAEFKEDGPNVRSGDLLPYVPQMVTRTDLAFTPTLTKLAGRNLDAHLGTGLSWLGGRPLPYGESGSDVLLVDARAELRLQEVEVSLDVFNLLGAEWYDGEFVYASNFSQGGAASLVPQRHVSVGAPRTLMLSLSLYI